VYIEFKLVKLETVSDYKMHTKMTGHVKYVGDIEGWGTGECQRKTLISQVVLKKMPKVSVRPNSGKYMPVQKKSNPIQ